MKPEAMFEGFDHAQYKDEAEQRWGHTPAWKQSQERASKYTQADWQAIKDESAEIALGLAALMDREPTDPAVQALIERHHRQICERFYDCPIAMYRGLADMWVNDVRFTKNIDKVKPGLAAFQRDQVLWSKFSEWRYDSYITAAKV